ncbi:MAG: hypothetical protein ACK5HT_21200 [Draconibacterium sp.]
MKKGLLLLLALFPLFAFAQTFNQAVGIRAGLTSGFEYRVYANDANSYKFLLGTRDEGVQLHAMKEFHQFDLFRHTDQLIFFYGAGFHVGYEQWQKRYTGYNAEWYKTRTAFLAGLDGLVGLEYIFYEVPISMGLEAKPYFDLFGSQMFNIELFDIGFTVKYHF